MLSVNENYALLPGAYLFAEIARRVRAFEAEHADANLVRLGIGDVTRPLAPAVVEALREAAAEMGTPDGFRGYSPDYGYAFLIDAIRQNDYASLGVSLGEDEIFISDGAKSDTSNIQELFAQDTRVAVTDPVYPVYVDSNAMAGRAGTFSDGRWSRLTYLPCTAENGFVPPLPERDVDVIYLCYPNNPTGTTLTVSQLQPFVDYARAHGAVLIYDAAYKAFVTRADVPRSIYEVPGAREVAIECCSFSKTAGFTGTRCAWMVIPRDVSGRLPDGARVSLNAMWKRRMGTKFNGVSYPIQRAAAAVYSPEGRLQCAETVAYYQRNAALIREGLESAGYTVYGGVDAPYVWLKTPSGEDSWAFFDRLLTRARVVGTPGAGFGPSGEGYFRLTAFGTLESTREAMRRIRERL